MLGSECISANLMLGPTEAGVVLESVVKSGTHFILLPHGKGNFRGAGWLQIWGRVNMDNLKLSFIYPSMHLCFTSCYNLSPGILSSYKDF